MTSTRSGCDVVSAMPLKRLSTKVGRPRVGNNNDIDGLTMSESLQTFEIRSKTNGDCAWTIRVGWAAKWPTNIRSGLWLVACH